MSTPIIAHKVPIHIHETAEEVLSDANKLEAGSKFSVTRNNVHETDKFLNSDGYDENTIVWTELSGNISGKRRQGSPTQEVMAAASENQTHFYISVVTNPTASAGSKGKRYKVSIESDPNDFEAGTSQAFDYGLKFSGPPVAF
ncbi:MAG TPA: hypothetical protein VFZ09_27590 [Archangium sp.]|uniref:phage tail tube protein n=1 Tax=Archangium sp. TaxID=1872627 RepID=UPI002E366FE8|nr:hypothetical protein [Archangium sp.]HEX5750024.1 hypothetical protein [Archangium sp.]